MGANRIEIAKQNRRGGGVRCCPVPDQLLHYRFRAAIWIGGMHRMLFVEGEILGPAVNCCG